MSWGSARVATTSALAPIASGKVSGLGCRRLATAVFEPTWLFFLQVGASPRRIAGEPKCGWIKEAMPFAVTFVGLHRPSWRCAALFAGNTVGADILVQVTDAKQASSANQNRG
jgi:hypothetical protein